MQITTLTSLLFETTSDYEQNLQTLLLHLKGAKDGSLIVAPEVCLSGFDYDNYEALLEKAPYFTKEIAKRSRGKVVVLTMLERVDGIVYNNVKVFCDGEMIFSRPKIRLFRFGGEHKYMQEGSDEDFKIIEVAGVKIAIFICFELRFKELWIQAEGADVIVTPSWWGKARSEHFATITQTLAILNECYVVASDSANDTCTALSGIITPQGEVHRNDGVAALSMDYDKKAIELMRRYLDIGIK